MGVKIFYDSACDTLLSARVANPERLPRRIIRLLHRVTRIEWDECHTEETARHREELLICVLTPKFNAAGKVWPRQTAEHRTSNLQRPTSNANRFDTSAADTASRRAVFSRQSECLDGKRKAGKASWPAFK